MEALAEFLPAVEKPCNLLVDAGKKTRSAEIELSLVNYQENSFEKTVAAVKK